MESEIWKDVPDYEGYYQVSNLGRVKSLERYISSPRGGFALKKEKILRNSISKENRVTVVFCVKGLIKTKHVHVLVAMAFLGHKACGYERVVDHIDNNPKNNHLSNLQVITQRKNKIKDTKKGSSKFIGVSWHKASKKWRATIFVNNKQIHLGTFKNEIDAHNAYEKKLNSLIY